MNHQVKTYQKPVYNGFHVVAFVVVVFCVCVCDFT